MPNDNISINIEIYNRRKNEYCSDSSENTTVSEFHNSEDMEFSM